MLSASAYTRKHLYNAKFNCVHYFDRARTALMRTAFACDIFCSLYDDMLCAKWKWLRFPMCVRICWNTETTEPTHNHHTISKYTHTRCTLVSTENAKSSCVKNRNCPSSMCITIFIQSYLVCSTILALLWHLIFHIYRKQLLRMLSQAFAYGKRSCVAVKALNGWTAAVGAATASASASTASHTQHWNFSHFDVQIFRLSRRQQYDSVQPFSLNIAFSANTRTIYFIVRFENIFPKNHVYESALKFVCRVAVHGTVTLTNPNMIKVNSNRLKSWWFVEIKHIYFGKRKIHHENKNKRSDFVW